MTQTMRERLITAVTNLRRLTVTVDGYFATTADRIYRESAEEIVDAILTELRTPDEGMIDAGHEYQFSESIFTAMIDVVIGKKP